MLLISLKKCSRCWYGKQWIWRFQERVVAIYSQIQWRDITLAAIFFSGEREKVMAILGKIDSEAVWVLTMYKTSSLNMLSLCWKRKTETYCGGKKRSHAWKVAWVLESSKKWGSSCIFYNPYPKRNNNTLKMFFAFSFIKLQQVTSSSIN